MSGPRIRRYELGDQGSLEAFFVEAWRSSAFGFDPTGAHADLRAIPAQYQSGRGEFWLLGTGAEILGTVALRELDSVTAEIKRLAVHPDYRGRGYGDHLLRYALDEATARRFRGVRLDTIRSPGPALHLFVKYGFEEIPRYNDNPDADVFMELALSAGGARPAR